MKKLFLLATPLLLLCFFLPQNTHAMKVKKFKHSYYGTWENTWSSYGTPGNTGYIEIKIKKIKKTGKIKDAHIWFSNTGTYMQAHGKIKKVNGVKQITLHYEENGWDYDDYVFTGTITAAAISGDYDHYSTYYSYEPYSWGGTAELTNQQ